MSISAAYHTSKHPQHVYLMRRVVITGLGAVTPLGVGIQRTWQRLVAGGSGLVSTRNLTPEAQYAELPSRVAGLVPTSRAGSWQVADWIEKGEARRMAKFTQYAVAATEQALDDAGWRPETQEEQEMTGVCLGSGIGNLEEMYDTSIAYSNGVSSKMNLGDIVMLRGLPRVIRRSLPCSFQNSSSISAQVTFP